MRIVLSTLGLLVVVAIVGLLARKQLGSASAPAAVPGLPAASAPASATVRQQGQQIQQQMKQAVEGAMQQARPMPEDK